MRGGPRQTWPLWVTWSRRGLHFLFPPAFENICRNITFWGVIIIYQLFQYFLALSYYCGTHIHVSCESAAHTKLLEKKTVKNKKCSEVSSKCTDRLITGSRCSHDLLPLLLHERNQITNRLFHNTSRLDDLQTHDCWLRHLCTYRKKQSND